MSSLSLGDLAQSFQLRRDNFRVKTDLQRLTHELSTGHKADLGKATRGNYGPLMNIDRQLSRLGAFETTAREAAMFSEIAQLAMGRVQDVGDDLGPKLISSELSGFEALNGSIAKEAEAGFIVTVDALNTQIGGKGIFGGTSTDRPALAGAETMLAELRAATAAQTTAAGVKAVVETWFAPGGGFETSGYTGSAKRLEGLRVGEGIAVDMPIKADDPQIREQLKGLAMGALLAEGPALEHAEKVELAKMAGTTIMGNQTGMSAMRSDLGSVQARIETAQTRNGSETMALQIARNDIVTVDPYQTATELQNVEAQLETLYTLTARLSRLNLTDYMR